MPLGHSNYHSFQLQAKKRFASSVLGLAYTISKRSAIPKAGAIGWRAAPRAPAWGSWITNNRRLDRSLAVGDAPQRLVFNYTVELPFGKGRHLLNHLGAADRLVSGWQLSGVYTAQVGGPVAVGTPTNLTGTFNAVTDVYGSYSSNSRPNNNGQSAMLSGSAVSRLNQWFNTSRIQPAGAIYLRHRRANTARRSLGRYKQPGLWPVQK